MKTASVLVVLSFASAVVAVAADSPAAATGAAAAPAPSLLRFPASPAGGPEFALASVRSVLSPALMHDGTNINFDINSFRVKEVLPLYVPDFEQIINGAGMETAKLVGYNYILTEKNNIAGVAEISTAAVEPGKNYVMIGFRHVYSGQMLANTLEALPGMLASGALGPGPFEVRLFYAYHNRDAGVIWLKSDTKGSDMVIPLRTLMAENPTTLEAYLQNFRTVQLANKARIDALAKTRPPAAPRPRDPAENLTWNTEGELNDYFVRQFVSTRGFGTGRLSSHAMSIENTMRLEPSPTNGKPASAAPSYIIDTLDLIGIAKHDAPVVFNGKGGALVSAGMGGISLGYPIQTRPLTNFEIKALAALRTGQDTSSSPTDGGGRIVVGAIRAQQSCIDCHTSSKVGDLFGAFSYHLIPAAKAGPVLDSKSP